MLFSRWLDSLRYRLNHPRRTWLRRIRRRRIDVAPAIERLETRCLLSVFTVTNTADAGAGSLREAITNANNSLLTVNATIVFEIPATDPNYIDVDSSLVGGDPDPDVFVIEPAMALPAISKAGTTIDGFTQATFGGDTNPFGPEIVLDGISAGTGAPGLKLASANNAVYGFNIQRFGSHGVFISGTASSGNTVAGNYIGTDATGTLDRGNAGDGVSISEASNNTIGGTAPGAGNVISGNNIDGVLLSGGSANTLMGNFIGTDATGLVDLGNSRYGVNIEGSSNNLIGGTAAGDRNVISGNNSAGVVLINIGAVPVDNKIQGNYIGLGADGDTVVANTGSGIFVQSAQRTTIGGTVAGAGNVISGNLDRGVFITLSNATDNVVQGNYIGTDAGGTLDRGNSGDGVLISNAASNTIGGTVAGAGNVITGNRMHGVRLLGTAATGNLVQGNLVGTNAGGTGAVLTSNGASIGNYGSGVFIDGASTNTIGGTAAGARNVISANTNGVVITGAGSGNQVQGNYIGTNAAGTADLGNSFYGVGISASGNVVGGTTTAARNVISGNNQYGVYLSGAQNQVQGNYIGTDAAGSADLGNTQNGVHVIGANNVIGGSASGAGNVISGNNQNGVRINGTGATGNAVMGNYIGLNAAGNSALGNGTTALGMTDHGVWITNASQNFIGTNGDGLSDADEGNVISGNRSDGVRIEGSSAADNTIAGNLIGLNAAGTAALGNQQHGVHVRGLFGGSSPGQTIIGTDGDGLGDADEGNVISGNAQNGVYITFSDGHIVAGNLVGLDAGGTVDLGNGQDGVYVVSSNNVIGGDLAVERNAISGNQRFGVNLDAAFSTNNQVLGNYIGTDVNGTLDRGNSAGGVMVNGGVSNIIGLPGQGNVISGNDDHGVIVSGSGTGNAIRGNAVFSNAGLGIDLAGDGATANDAGDADTGANNLQNFPVLTSATPGASTRVVGTFNGAATSSFTLDFYANDAGTGDASGHGEGQHWLGSTTVITDSAGNASFDVTLTAATSSHQVLSATATDSGGNTSEFADNLVLNEPPTVTLSGNTSTLEGTATTYTALVSDPDTGEEFTFKWYVNGALQETFTTTAAQDTFTFTPADNGIYDIRVDVTDKVGTSATALQTVTVANAAPSNITLALSDASINEGSSTTLSGSFVDPGADTFTVSINWGDGSAATTLSGSQVTKNTSTGRWEFSAAHTYTDDNASDQYTISVTVTDDDGGSSGSLPSGIVSWWKAEGDANDSVDGNNGTLVGDAAFATGKVGQAFSFDGAGDAVRVAAAGSLDSAGDTGLTLEAWVQPATIAVGRHPLIEWFDGVHLWHSVHTPGQLFANVVDTTGGHHFLLADAVLTDGAFQHVALTYDQSSGLGALYVNGTQVLQANLGSFTPKTDTALSLGERAAGSFGEVAQYSAGLMDEVSIYHRALTAAELQLIVNAGSAGKTATTTVTVSNVAPSNVTLALSDASINEGQSTTLSGSFVDPGTDTFTVSINWGDGSAATTLSGNQITKNVDSGRWEFSAPHTYADDGTYTVSVGVTDDDGGTATATPGWADRAAMPTPRMAFALGVVDGVVYATGGSNQSGLAIDAVEAYDPAIDTWTARASMPTARWGHGVGVIDGILYAAGGISPAGTVLGTLEAYDPATDSWTTLASMPTARFHLDVAVMDGILYAVGGAEGPGGFSAAVEAYDPTTNTWTSKAPVTIPRRFLGLESVDGVLYAVSGETPTPAGFGTVEAYDPATDAWTARAPMLTPRAAHAVGVVNGVLYAVGGNSATTPAVTTLESYHPATDTWHSEAPMPTGRDLLAVDVAGGVLYAVGGRSSNFLISGPAVEAFTPPLQVTVENVAPEIVGLALSSTTILENDSVTLTGSFTDPGTADTHTVSINWGDGQTTSLATSSLPAGAMLTRDAIDPALWHFSAPHTYLDDDADDQYTISVRVTDDDGGVSSNLPMGLISWWKADGNAQDSVDGNHGALQDGATFAAGRVGQAFSLEATADYVLVPDADNLSFGNGTTDSPFSIETWVYADTLTHAVGRWLVNKRDGSSGDEWQLLVLSDGAVNLSLLDEGPADYLRYATTGGYVTTGTWHHVAATYDGSGSTAGINMYVDGVLATANMSLTGEFGNYVAMQNGTAPVKIGQAGWDTAHDWDGQIDELAIYSRVLTAAEVEAIYTVGSAGKGSATTTVTVANVAPVVAAGADSTASAEGVFTGSGSFIDPGTDVWTATVDYGDGSGTQPLVLNADKTFNLSHAYGAIGTYTTTVTVSDDDGGTDDDQALVTVEGTTFTVDTTADVVDNTDGLTSLREAVAAANLDPGPDAIVFATGLTGTVALTSGELAITDHLAIYGPGADVLTVSGGGVSRIFNIAAGVTVSIDALTLTAGQTTGNGGAIVNAGTLSIAESTISGSNSPAGGGGIYNTGTLTVTSSTFFGNSATGATGDGGAIYNTGDATIINSTFSGNSAIDSGAAIRNHGGTLTLTHSTITDNAGSFGALYNSLGTVTIGGTIVAGNVGSNSSVDVNGSFTSQGYNLIGVTTGAAGFGASGDVLNPAGGAKLGPLQDNGGTTFTHALLPGSPAIDAASASLAPGFDQRGLSRPQDGDGNGTSIPDIGAFELRSFVVTTTSDSGAGSLRQALLDANAHAGFDAVVFNIPGTGVQTISPASALPTVTDPVVIDGATQPGYATTPLVEIDGSLAGTTTNGLVVSAPGSVIGGLAINGFGNTGVVLSGGNTLVADSYIGTDAGGTIDRGNGGNGIQISSAGNTVRNNLISGNDSNGVWLTGSAANDNVIEGNRIGVNAAGTAALGNTFSGVHLSAGTGNRIGGATAAARNIISANLRGIVLHTAATHDNVLQGNYIGTDGSGTSAVGNTQFGVWVLGGAHSNLIGTDGDGVNDAAEPNLISANLDDGLRLEGAGTNFNVVTGNYIGTDAAGTAALGNASGVFIQGASNNTIGGTTAGAGNVISGNRLAGVTVFGVGTDNNIIQGNFIGTDAAGIAPLGNASVGIHIDGGAAGTIIGGDDAADGAADGVVRARNVISGTLGTAQPFPLNGGPGSGIYTNQAGAGTVIRGNYVGTNAAGTAALANARDGITLTFSSSGVQVGGSTAGAGNLLSGNVQYGIAVSVSNAAVIQGNYVGTDAAGAAKLANGHGVLLSASAGVAVGGASAGEGNVISGNASVGLHLVNADGNSIQGNRIGTNAAGTAALANRPGIRLDGSAGNVIGTNGDGVDDAAEGNLISGNIQQGVYIVGSGASGNVVAGNYIGTNAAGTAALGNSHGVFLQDAPGNIIGGSAPGAGNLLSGNRLHGVEIAGTSAAGNVVQGNFIGTDAGGNAALANSGRGILVNGAQGTIIGTNGDGVNDAAEGNVISGNAGSGVEINGLKPDVASLAVVDQLVDGTLAATTATATIPEADLNDPISGVGGNWSFNHAVPGGGGDHYAVVATGTFQVAAAGAYSFAISGDDGGRLRIDGVDVIVDDTLHAFADRFGEATLTTGSHTFEWVGFERGGGAAWELAVAAGSGKTGPVSTTNGWHVVGDPAAAVTLNGSIAVTAYYAEATSGGNTVIAGNFIGTNAAGTSALGNGGSGVLIQNGAQNNRIGTNGDGVSDDLERNVIAASTFHGVEIRHNGTDFNVVAGNYLGTNATGTAPLGNGFDGVAIWQAAAHNRIGTDGSNDAFNASERNVISGNGRFGVYILQAGSDHNVVAGNYIGTNVAGTIDLGNRFEGVRIESGASQNRVGTNGDGVADETERNVISGNSSHGVLITGVGTQENIVAGNYIGVNALGTSSTPAPMLDVSSVALTTSGPVLLESGGVVVAEAEDHFTDRTTVNGRQWRVVPGEDPGDVAHANARGGAYLQVLPDSGGGSSTSPPFGTVPAVQYTVRIATPGQYQLFVRWDGHDGGSDSMYGSIVELRDGTGGQADWYRFSHGGDANFDTIPWDGVGEFEGVSVGGNNVPAAWNITEPGDYTLEFLPREDGVSLDAFVLSAVSFGNGLEGVLIANGAAANRIGTDGDGIGDLAERNVISGNTGSGITLRVTHSNTIAGNFIGTDAAGTAAVGNASPTTGLAGIAVFQGSHSNIIGTNGDGVGDAVEGNLISGNGRWANIFVQDVGTEHNVIAGNLIGTDVTGTQSLGVSGHGIEIKWGASHNLVGTNGDGVSDELERNVISGNAGQGIFLWSRVNPSGVPEVAQHNVIAGNYIGTDITGTADLGNAVRGVLISAGATFTRIGTDGDGVADAAERNVISGNNFRAIEITGLGSDENLVAGNYIGTDASGTQPLGNNQQGVVLSGGAQRNVIGTNGDGLGDAAEGNVISANQFVGVFISGALTDENVVAGNFIGTDVTGTVDLGNGGAGGVRVLSGAQRNRIGTDFDGVSDLLERNVISGDSRGVQFDGAGTTHNVLAGNYIGTTADGTAALGNGPNQGVLINAGAESNTLDRNVISGNFSHGVQIDGSTTRENRVTGNQIGTNAAGTAALGNLGHGVSLSGGTQANIIGTDGDGLNDAAEGNVISGNLGDGVRIAGAGTSFNIVAGNFIGTDVSGAAAIANSLNGVFVNAGAAGNTIGGSTASQRNVISGNTQSGVLFENAGDGNTVEGNFVGVAATGAAGLGNSMVGVRVQDTSHTLIRGNVISANAHGVAIARTIGPAANYNRVEGNIIGLDATATADLGNSVFGLFIDGGSGDTKFNVVGGSTADTRNIISGNNSAGVLITGAGATDNVVAGNHIGTNGAGTAALGNSSDGLRIESGAKNNRVGTNADGIADAAERNVISGNAGNGVHLLWAGTDFNTIAGNYIGTDLTGTVDLGNAGNGVLLQSGPANNTIGGSTAAARNVISGNDQSGVYLLAFDPVVTVDNAVIGNYIGTTVSGLAALGNAGSGVTIATNGHNRVGGATAGERNVISGNLAHGIFVSGGDGATIQGNYIGLSAAGTAAIGNREIGVFLNGGSGHLIGGGAAGAGNVISGNTSRGLFLQATHNVRVQGNRIGTNAAGTAPLPNAWGVEIGSGSLTATGNIIGTDGDGVKDASEGNLISGNTQQGVYIVGSGASGNVVAGNRIGTDINGTVAIGNAPGVLIAGGAHDNRIGTNADGMSDIAERNVISGNRSSGVVLLGDGTSANTVAGNFIGTDFTGNGPLANLLYGIDIIEASGNTIGGAVAAAGNTIAFNAIGVRVTGAAATGNAIRRNSMHSNGGLGIDLGSDGVTINDAGDPAADPPVAPDADAGPNGLQNFPELAIVFGGANTRVSGTLTSTPDTTFELEFFGDSAADPTGFGEGRRYLGSTTVATNAAGVAAFDNISGTAFTLGATFHGEVVTATATDASGNTSEFSAAIGAIFDAPPAVDSDSLIVTVLDEETPDTATFGTATTTVPENQPFRLDGQLENPDPDDAHTVTLDWGDGSDPDGDGAIGETFALSAGELGFSVGHVYAAKGHYTVTVFVTDDDGASGQATIDVTAGLVLIDELTLDAATIDEGQAVTVSGRFSSPALGAPGELFAGSTALWSDGTETPLTIDAVLGTFSTSRTFTDDEPTGDAAAGHPAGRFTVEVTIVDTVVDDKGNLVGTDGAGAR
ncbi:MAG: right-handed parallel beta-helix repeat-containing protein, partial [Planctomycetes bacterium]|nr:right-handed parallel beta-helix repeat-containing protein [Planctomycetota bacterium]